jgi:hypothetical protein
VTGTVPDRIEVVYFVSFRLSSFPVKRLQNWRFHYCYEVSWVRSLLNHLTDLTFSKECFELDMALREISPLPIVGSKYTIVNFFIQLKPYSLLPVVSTLKRYVFLIFTSMQCCIAARCQSLICILVLYKCDPSDMSSTLVVSIVL